MDPDTLAKILTDPVLQERFITWVTTSLKVGATPWGRYVSSADVERRFSQEGHELAASVWLMVQLSREPFETLALVDHAAVPFRYSRSAHHELAMEVEFACSHSGEWWTAKWLNQPVGLSFLAGVMRRDEAWATCALDGHLVPRSEAREMLATGRTPRNAAESAVYTAYAALCEVQSLRLRSPPSLEWLLGLHERLTAGSTVRSDAPGRLRRSGEEPQFTGAAPPHVPLPPAGAVPEQLAHVLAMFERKPLDRMSVEKALLALFAITYLRPFAEGNGRIARALYYAFLSERKPITPVQLVALSPLLRCLNNPFDHWTRKVREDLNDVGYFAHPTLFLVRGAMRRVKKALATMEEVSEAVQRSFPSAALNERQIQALAVFVRNPGQRLTVEAHRQQHATVYETARTDLTKLADMGLLHQAKEGRAFSFRAAADFAQRLDLAG